MVILNKEKMKAFTLTITISLIIMIFPQISLMFFTTNKDYTTEQILCSLDLNTTLSKPQSGDHPIISSPATTDLTTSNPPLSSKKTP
uniref:F-ORF n=1 Tax=Sinanodonta woodiana TaxID=1069815 RepID=F2WZ99_SINWO|nr:F-ORF [Sinanodonta woodiana]ADP23783.1 F ORF [Sinanodonta woodiana]ADP23797.1 F ORF [Sinanodonta woodiana]ADP23811.1 F ORF [Sinanodonta woodiana]ADP23825.1 F ORF [Sinanodonta woodiana]ADP23839.1 F ORF [Sinanodonta woodiana]